MKNIKDYGTSGLMLEELLKGKTQVAAALNNADTDGVLLPVIAENIDRILGALRSVSAELNDAPCTVFLPENADKKAAETIASACEAAGVPVETGIVNVRKYADAALLHFMTLLQLSGDENAYVSVDGAAAKKVAQETVLKELVSADNVKGFFNGYEFYDASWLDKAVSELPLECGLFKVLTTGDCVVVEMEKALMRSRVQSCGKCVFCREGLLQLQFVSKEITEGRGKNDMFELAREIGGAMTYSTPCSMGRNSSRVLLSAAEIFRSEIDEHIRKKNCPAGVCFSKETYYVDPFACVGCEECADVCPKDCIEGKKGFIHMIDDFDCDRCGKCVAACEEDAIIKTTDKLPKLPDRLTKVGRFKKH